MKRSIYAVEESWLLMSHEKANVIRVDGSKIAEQQMTSEAVCNHMRDKLVEENTRLHGSPIQKAKASKRKKKKASGGIVIQDGAYDGSRWKTGSSGWSSVTTTTTYISTSNVHYNSSNS
jgi:hypothetical protein